jgi:hypothetical protein
MNVLPKVKPDKDFVKFCNSLRCPICDSQLDGNILPKKALLYCCVNNSEYSGVWLLQESLPEEERSIYYYADFEYEINVRRQGPTTFYTTIDRYNTGTTKFYREQSRKRLFDITGNRIVFFHKRLEEAAFLKKMKTYILFS